MWLLNKTKALQFYWFLSIFILSFSHGKAQNNCTRILSGKVLDESTHLPLEFAAIQLEETGIGMLTNEKGEFKISNICPGDYHIWVNHSNCEKVKFFIRIQSDTVVHLHMHHHAELLQEIEVHGEQEQSSKVSRTLGKSEIEENAARGLSELLEGIAGVSSIKNGSGISKPVIHGMYGNRVSIMNNGVAQSGQQWGNDHAPEIDPFMADHVAVIKGASALEYGGQSLGGVVLVEMDDIAADPHFHGGINYIFQTNGLGHTLNFKGEKKDKWFSWRTMGTLKLRGDQQSPDYFLTNTGNREQNGSFKAEKWVNDHWFTSAYYSLFKTDIGILRGSHIGNLTDLTNALTADRPFFTRDSFSYQIQAPFQKVTHHLIKLESVKFLDDNRSLNFTYGGQINNRREFDVRRSGRTDIPALSLFQTNHFLEGKYLVKKDSITSYKTGIQFTMVDNTNNPETEILPLIPDYRSYQTGLFYIHQKKKGRWFVEYGARADYKNLEALTISRTLPRKIERFQHHFVNGGLSSGIKYRIAKNVRLNMDAGLMRRSPQVNELYSYGLHQGVSGLEEGNPNLVPETSLKGVLSGDWNWKDQLFVQVLGYYQYVQDYMYLEPSQDFRLTIRGAFPVFHYTQTNAALFGSDVLVSYEPAKSLKIVGKYAFLRGNDVRNNAPLVFMAPNNATGSIQYGFRDNNDTTGKKRSGTEIGLQGRYVFEQTHLLATQDFLAPPKGYLILRANLGTTFKVGNSDLKMSLSVDNLLNTRYRDYLNRLRYFADDMGRNVQVRLNYSF